MDVPGATPVTTPVAGLTEAMAVVPLLQVPGPITSLNVVEAVPQTVVIPAISRGIGFTVTMAVDIPQPEDSV
jgi:hypothetical protein